jgi:hypothetical protein
VQRSNRSFRRHGDTACRQYAYSARFPCSDAQPRLAAALAGGVQGDADERAVEPPAGGREAVGRGKVAETARSQ